MSIISKPIYSLLSSYFEQLFTHPLRTKAVTSCVIATAGNYASQKIAGVKKINQDSLLAYGAFGLFFAGPLSHYFYVALENSLREDLPFRKLVQFLSERLIFAPFFQFLSLYVLARFEGKDHHTAINNLIKLYWPLLKANWRYLSIIIFANINFVPPILRVLFSNIMGFFWIIYLANKRRQAQIKDK